MLFWIPFLFIRTSILEYTILIELFERLYNTLES